MLVQGSTGVGPEVREIQGIVLRNRGYSAMSRLSLEFGAKGAAGDPEQLFDPV